MKKGKPMNKLNRMLEDLAYDYHHYDDLSDEQKYELADLYLQENPEKWINDDTIYSDRATTMALDMLRNGYTQEQYYDWAAQMCKDIAGKFEYEIRKLLDREIAIRASDDKFISENAFRYEPDLVEPIVWKGGRR